ncbi:DNA-methyltransferase [Blastopirellula retiformator]|uniref:Methyltransferase n=1 Tax=Blastopirellula retiformator TaxID=2527970 RepID=A0A5C5V4F3_9BACT|nr:site-specific DNA-methyltransferase [Blastopirellula retiformator]TWT32622.1 Modification methylase DpnIIB [Blastopirellula retiformator]
MSRRDSPAKSKKSPSPPPLDSIACGDATQVIAAWPDEFIDTVITSPPYFQQRDYAGDDQIGLEKTPGEYIERLIALFAQVQRTLKASGSLWVVLGDKYVNGELLGMPWRFALAMKDAGWILRSDVIWQKPNAMPSSVKTRPTTDHEYVFFFSKSKEYYYDADAIREPHVTFSDKSQMKGGRRHFNQRGGTPEAGKNGGASNLHDGRWDQAFHPQGRNKRTVWSIPLSKFREAHFAVFPERLVETCLLATCPLEGIALDPFMGSGTVGVVARKLGRHYLGVDQSAEYCEMARRRLAKETERVLF